ncbi:MAG: sulfite exporter TauE/SafE family protein [bacterium]
MLSILILIGFMVGALGTLIGAGGGFILMPVLLLIYPSMNVKDVTLISMIVIFFNSLSGTAAYLRMKRVDIKTGAMFASATLPGSVLGTLATKIIGRGEFNILFGVFLISISLLLSFIKKPQPDVTGKVSKHQIKCEVKDCDGNIFKYSYNCYKGILISVFTGFISPILGIGGGIIHVPAMIRMLCIPAHIATATSHFTLMIMSAASIATHFIISNDFKFLSFAVLLSIGAILGAQVGAKLSRHVNEKFIVIILSIALFAAGIRIIFLNR